MSFIVKGMDLPTKDTAPLNFTIWSDGTVYCRNVNDIITKVEVVQIAKDHGRIGDLDALAQKCSPPDWCVWLSEIEDAPALLEAEDEQ